MHRYRTTDKCTALPALLLAINVERVATAVRAQQHENALILNSLHARGVTFNIEDATFHRTDTDAARSPSPTAGGAGRSRKKKKRTPGGASKAGNAVGEGPSEDEAQTSEVELGEEFHS